MSKDLELSGFMRRAFAFMLDGMLFGFTYLCLDLFLPVTSAAIIIGNFGLQISSLALLCILYYLYGQSPGKWLLGIKIIGKEQEKLGLKQVLLRIAPWMILYILSNINLIQQLQGLSQDQLILLKPVTAVKLVVTGQYNLDDLAAVGKSMKNQGSTTSSMVSGWLHMALFIGSILSILADSKKRAIHDFIAGTLVVRKKPNSLQ